MYDSGLLPEKLVSKITKRGIYFREVRHHMNSAKVMKGR